MLTPLIPSQPSGLYVRRVRYKSMVSAATICVIVGAAITGCGTSPQGVIVPQGADDLPMCPLTQLSLSELAIGGAPGCDLEGSTIGFDELEGKFSFEALREINIPPSLTITAVGASFSQDDAHGRELIVVNWGVPGVAVALVDNGRLVDIWASSSEARDLHQMTLDQSGVRS